MAGAKDIRRRGLLFVLSSPSGAGKSTIARLLLAADKEIAMSVSATTRPRREGETDGKDYHFVEDTEFDARIEAGEFLEWANVFGRRYGTLRSEVLGAIETGRDVLLDIDWQGTQQLKQIDPDIVRVFLLPPSMAELERRLKRRGTDSEDVVAARMARAADEISHWAEYDYVLVNDDAGACLEKVTHILKAERLKRTRRPGLADFVRALAGRDGAAARDRLGSDGEQGGDR
ncbi:MAG: guanylate kinase [Sphingomonadaceae bacterium]